MAEANQLQKDKGQLMTSKLINYVTLKLIILLYLQTELRLPQEASVDIYKASQKAYNNASQHKEYQILAYLWKNCMNSYLTEKIPGPSQHLQVTQWIASIDGKEEHDAFNSRMEEKQPSTTQASAKNSPSSQQEEFQCEKAATSSKQGQKQGKSLKALQPGLQNPKDSAGFHGKCISDGQKNDGIIEKGGSQMKILEMISDIFDSIPELYEAINDVKTHVSDKTPSICNNVKTNSLSLSQINEKFMCFEKVLREIKTSDNENSFGNKLNEKSAIIKELIDKYSKFNIDYIIETRIKQAISTIKEENKSVLENISK
ncbi:hypothetical protein O181_114813 [Austropuccinia psidii MF-1]|uniref:Uncharacterized protein n=1 Tax=Austropuccinia psidii MF-1 TaxID=1389203 RepID=A0A9Q3K5F8_9BASI|nr:hypothetical protein [Austropuccinia psidii MF-1]